MESFTSDTHAKFQAWLRSPDSDDTEHAPRPVIRVWGHADNLENAEEWGRRDLEEPWSFNIQLDDNDHIYMPNAAYKKGVVSVYLTETSQAIASRHTKVRLDKYSDPKSHLPFVQQIEPWFVGDGRSIVLVHLFDRGGSKGCRENQEMSKFLPKLIPQKDLIQAVNRHLHGPSPASAGPQVPVQANPLPNITPKDKVVAVTNILLVRGRLKRRNRRHGESPSDLGTAETPKSPTSPVQVVHVPQVPRNRDQEKVEKLQVVVRGRMKRRSNRHNLSNHELSQGYVDNLQFQQVPINPTTIPHGPHLMTNLASRLPENLKGLLRILLLGPSRNDFSDAVVIPLLAPYDHQKQQLIGSLVIPRPYLVSMKSDRYTSGIEENPGDPEWMYPLRTGPPTIKVTGFTTQGCRDVSPGDKHYWQKFPLGLISHLRHKIIHMKQRQELNVFDFSRWTCFNHPQVIYPDQNEGSLAPTSEYFDLFDCWHSVLRPGSWELPEFARWMDVIDEQRHQEYETFDKGKRYGIYKVKDTTYPDSNNSIARELENKGKLSSLAVNTASYYSTLQEFEKQMRWKKEIVIYNPDSLEPPEDDESDSDEETNFDPPFGGPGFFPLSPISPHEQKAFSSKKGADEEKSLTEEEKAKGASSLTEQLYKQEKREMWQGTWDHSHVPLWQQERMLQRVKSLSHSNDAKLAPRIKNYAAFQYGLCLLNGFGTIQDIEAGLHWVRHGASGGCRVARALVHGLYRAYDLEHKLSKDKLQWLIEEAKSFSEYAQHELGEAAGAGLSTDVRQKHLYAAKYEIDQSWKGLIEPEDGEKEFMHFFNTSLLSRLAVYSPQYLARQLQLQDQGTQELLVPILSEDAPKEKPPLFYRTAMRWACCFAELPTLEVLIENGLGFIFLDDLQEFLQLALLRGKTSLSLYLLDQQAMTPETEDIKQKDQYMTDAKLAHRNPLFLLHHVPDDEVGQLVQKIVSLGFDVNAKANVKEVEVQSIYPVSRVEATLSKDPWEMHLREEILGHSVTPLRWAIIKNKAGLVRALIDAGAKFPLRPERQLYSQKMPSVWTADILTVAVLEQPCYNIDILHMFFEKHGEQTAQPVFAESPLGLIAMEPDSPMRRLRIAQHVDGGRYSLFAVLSLIREYQSDSDAELFWAAAMNGHEDIVRYLINQGVDIELRWKGMTPLHTAVLHGRTGIFNLLIEEGADPYAVTSDKGISALHLLFWKAKPEAAELLMFEKLYEMTCDVSGGYGNFAWSVSPLHLAVMNSRVKAVERLVELGADTTMVLGKEIMTTVAGEQHTAWGVEQQRKRINAVKWGQIGDMEVPLRPIEIMGYTAAGIILMREDMFMPNDAAEMLKIIVNAPRTVNSGIERFYTKPDIQQTIPHLLAWSVLREKSDILDWILDVGKRLNLDLNVKDVHGDTPLHYAYAVVGPEFNKKIDDLLKHGADPTIRNSLGLAPCDMRTHILTRHFATKTHPLQFNISLRKPFDPKETKLRAPYTASPECQPLFSLENHACSGPQIWDAKTRSMVDIPPVAFGGAEPGTKVFQDQQVMVEMKTLGWEMGIPGRYPEKVTNTAIVLEVPEGCQG